MFEIETFTAHPDLLEDRIRIDALDTAGQSQSIFLTRRLADRFVPLLVERIESHVQPGVPRELGLAMDQQQLRIERAENPAPEVQLAEGARRWLCVTIHLSGRPDELEWTLTDDGENTAAMPLSGAGPRAVLDIFLLMYQQMEWGLDAFPGWLTQEAELPDGARRTLN